MPQKLTQFKAMKLDPDYPGNDPSMLQKGMTFDDHYVILGEIEQAPGHVIVFNMSRGVMVGGMLHPERFTAIPEDEM